MCVLILVCLFLAFVSLCWVVQVCVRRLLFWYCVEGVVICHEGTDALSEVTDMHAYIPQEIAAFPTSHDHAFFWVHFSQVEFHGEP